MPPKKPPKPPSIKPLPRKTGNQTPKSKPRSRKGGPPQRRTPQVVIRSPGLEYLAQLEYLFVSQQVAPMEVVTNFNVENCYNIFNVRGEMIYFAKESSDFLERNFFEGHKFEMTVWNSVGQPIIHLVKPFVCNCCCANRGEMYVYAPADRLAGTIVHEGTTCQPSFIVLNASGKAVYKIDGPCCPKCNADFPVYEIGKKAKSKPIGKISKHWSGILKETYSKADNFGVQFPLNLSVQMKALFLGACIMIDYLFFEESNNNHSNHHHGGPGFGGGPGVGVQIGF